MPTIVDCVVANSHRRGEVARLGTAAVLVGFRGFRGCRVWVRVCFFGARYLVRRGGSRRNVLCVGKKNLGPIPHKRVNLNGVVKVAARDVLRFLEALAAAQRSLATAEAILV